jgi:hypothetical protein
MLIPSFIGTSSAAGNRRHDIADTAALRRCVERADTQGVWRGFLWPGLVGIGLSAFGVILFLAGAATGVDGVAGAGMILAMTGFFLGIGQVLKLPRTWSSYLILLVCATPVACFMVFVAARVA